MTTFSNIPAELLHEFTQICADPDNAYKQLRIIEAKFLQKKANAAVTAPDQGNLKREHILYLAYHNNSEVFAFPTTEEPAAVLTGSHDMADMFYNAMTQLDGNHILSRADCLVNSYGPKGVCSVIKAVHKSHKEHTLKEDLDAMQASIFEMFNITPIYAGVMLNISAPDLEGHLVEHPKEGELEISEISISKGALAHGKANGLSLQQMLYLFGYADDDYVMNGPDSIKIIAA